MKWIGCQWFINNYSSLVAVVKTSRNSKSGRGSSLPYPEYPAIGRGEFCPDIEYRSRPCTLNPDVLVVVTAGPSETIKGYLTIIQLYTVKNNIRKKISRENVKTNAFQQPLKTWHLSYQINNFLFNVIMKLKEEITNICMTRSFYIILLFFEYSQG